MMSKLLNIVLNNKIRLFFILLSLVSFIYVLIRALSVEFANDEISSFYFYIQPSDFISYAHTGDANNHITNTLCANILYRISGFSHITMRLGSVFSFIIYCLYIYKISTLINDKKLKILFAFLLITPVNFLQFFALSRGYGFSFAFLTAGIWYLLRLTQNWSFRSIILFQLFFSLALLSNLSLMLITLISSLFAFILTINHYFSNKQAFITTIRSLSIFFLLAPVVAFGLFLGYQLKESGALYYGNLNGLWDLTVMSLINLLFESQSIIFQISLITTLCLFCYLFFVKLKPSFKKQLLNKNIIISIIFLITILGIKLMAVILKVNYPEDRVALYLFPILFIALLLLIDNTSHRIIKFSSIVILVPLIISLLSPVNLSTISIWKNDAIPDRYYTKISSNKNQQIPPIISGYHTINLAHINKSYRIDKGKSSFLTPWKIDEVNDEGTVLVNSHPALYADYIYASEMQIKSIKNHFVKIDSNQFNNIDLWHRKSPTLKTFFDKSSFNTEIFDKEYFELMRKTYDSVKSDALLIHINCNISSEYKPLRAKVILDITNKTTNERISYDYFPLNFLKKEWYNDSFNKSFYLRNLPKNDQIEILVYLWNENDQTFSLTNGKLSIYNLSRN